MTECDCPELERFVRGEIDAAAFPHREHVRMAFQMLQRHDFPETVLHFSQALQAMAARAGRPERFNQTVTIAFLALIAQRMEREGALDFAALLRAHPELLDKRALSRWYRPQRLASEAARRAFLLPGSAAMSAARMLAVFALAQVLSALDGRWPTQFLQYAASTVLIVAMGRVIEGPRDAAR